MDTLTLADSIGLIELAGRATILLGAALVLSRALARAAAATRHLLWSVTFVLLLALPVANAWLPAWELPLLPAGPDEPGIVSAPARAGAVVLAPGRGSGSGAATPGVAGSSPKADDRASAGREPLPLALLLWALGSAAAMASVTIGTLRFRAIVRSGKPIRNPVWLRQTARLRLRLGIDAEVRLLETDAVGTPMTGGWRRPVIVLPPSSSTWTPERREVVLLHELIHVRRHDALRQLLGQAALSLYWFHPLSWIAARRAAASREQACDEAVLELGTRPSEYAGHLLALAEGLHAAPALASLPMIQPSELERRIMAILSPTRPRTSALATAALLFLLGALGLSAAVARPVQDAAPVVAPPEPGPEPGIASLVPGTGPVGKAPLPSTAPSPTALPGAGGAPGFRAPRQDPTCRAGDEEGRFDGTLSIRQDAGRTRYERAGWADGDRLIQRYVGDLRLCMRTHGDVVMSDDGMEVRAIGSGGWVVLESEDDGLQRLVITEEADGIRYAWSVDGRERAFDDDARAWREGMFTVLQAYWEASRLRGQQSTLRGRISSHRGHISSLNGQISSHRGHISSLEGQVSSLRGHVSSLNGRISSLNGHVSSLNGQISSYRGQISSLRSAIRATGNAETRVRLEDEIDGYEARIREVESEIERFDVTTRVADVRAEIDAFDLEQKVRRVEQEIEDYDLDARVRGIEQEIEDYDLDGRIRGLEREIEELDADRRADALERGVESDLAALRRLIERL